MLSWLGFACECRLHAAVCTLLPDIIIYGIYDYRMVYYHALHRKVVTIVMCVVTVVSIVITLMKSVLFYYVH